MFVWFSFIIIISIYYFCYARETIRLYIKAGKDMKITAVVITQALSSNGYWWSKVSFFTIRFTYAAPKISPKFILIYYNYKYFQSDNSKNTPTPFTFTVAKPLQLCFALLYHLRLWYRCQSQSQMPLRSAPYGWKKNEKSLCLRITIKPYVDIVGS